jgi:hypothetical protein
MQKLPIKNGVVTYKIGGNEKGTQITYIKNYGLNQVIYKSVDLKIMNKKPSYKKAIYITPKFVYEVDFSKNIAFKNLRMEKLLHDIFEKLNPKERQKVIHSLSLQQEEAQSILGYACYRSVKNGKIEHKTYQGNLTLKSQTDIMGFSSHMIATKIQKAIVNRQTFLLPANIIIKSDQKEYAKTIQKAKEIISSLINPQKKADSFNSPTREKPDLFGILQEGIKSLEN